MMLRYMKLDSHAEIIESACLETIKEGKVSVCMIIGDCQLSKLRDQDQTTIVFFAGGFSPIAIVNILCSHAND